MDVSTSLQRICVDTALRTDSASDHLSTEVSAEMLREAGLGVKLLLTLRTYVTSVGAEVLLELFFGCTANGSPTDFTMSLWHYSIGALH